MIVGFLSTWQEGRLALGALRSLLGVCSRVIVGDGPVGDDDITPDVHIENSLRTDWRPVVKRHPTVAVMHGQWASDAVKRTAMLDRTRASRQSGPWWAVVVDGDELLLWPEYLPDLIAFAEAQAREQGKQPFALNLRITELDGSCGSVNCRVFRGDLIAGYVLSSHVLETRTGAHVTLPNQPLLLGTEPDSIEFVGSVQRRRPLAGEPHLLHRSLLRDPSRQAARLHVAEAEELAKFGLSAGVERRDDQTGVRIWLPQ